MIYITFFSKQRIKSLLHFTTEPDEFVATHKNL